MKVYMRTLRKRLITKCDVIFSKLVRKKGFCEKCNKVENLQCSHIHPRDTWSVRWDYMNAFCLCAGCHKWWWHQEPILAAEFTKEKLGLLNYEQLNQRARIIKQWKEWELKELLESLIKEYERSIND